MSILEPPFLEEALRSAELKINRILGAKTKISIHIMLDDRLAEIIEFMDSQMFREELRYTRTEILERGEQKGFILFLCTVEEKPICLLYGYADPEVANGFYLDTLATLIGGKGIGSTLLATMLIYCFEAGFNILSLYTEEKDEKNRPLRKFYEAVGLEYILTNNFGDLMQIQLDPKHLASIYNKYVWGQESLNQQPMNG